jgi:hypothetical protein
LTEESKEPNASNIDQVVAQTVPRVLQLQMIVTDLALIWSMVSDPVAREMGAVAVNYLLSAYSSMELLVKLASENKLDALAQIKLKFSLEPVTEETMQRMFQEIKDLTDEPG